MSLAKWYEGKNTQRKLVQSPTTKPSFKRKCYKNVTCQKKKLQTCLKITFISTYTNQTNKVFGVVKYKCMIGG